MSTWALDGFAFSQEVERWIAQLHIQQRRHLPRHANHAKAARQIRREFDIQNDIAKHISQRRARHITCVVIHDDDALMLIGDAQFFFRTDHALVVDAAQLPALERHLFRLLALAIPDGRSFHSEGAPNGRAYLALVFVSE